MNDEKNSQDRPRTDPLDATEKTLPGSDPVFLAKLVDEKSATQQRSNATDDEAEEVIILRCNEKNFDVVDLQSKFVVVDSAELAEDAQSATVTPTYQGVIVNGDRQVNVRLQPREFDGDNVTMDFVDLPIQSGVRINEIRWMVSANEKTASPAETSGGTPSADQHRVDQPATQASIGALSPARVQQPASSTMAQPKSPRRGLPLTALAAGMAGLIGMSIPWMEQKSIVVINDAIVAGDHSQVLPLQTGTIAEILVTPGQRVTRGTVIARLTVDQVATSDELADEPNQETPIESNLRFALLEREAYQEELEKAEQTVRAAKQKIEQDLRIAKASLTRAAAAIAPAQAKADKLTELLEDGNVARVKVDAATAKLTDARAIEVERQQQIESLRTALVTINKNIIIDGQKALNPVAAVQTKITLAEAKISKLEDQIRRQRSRLAQEAEPTKLIDVRADTTGTVASISVDVGDRVGLEDTLMELNASDQLWANGQVSLADASLIRVGQTVDVVIPHDAKTLAGKIRQVGSVGADAASIPVRVDLPLSVDSVPSGSRLEMTVLIVGERTSGMDWVGKELANWGNDQQPSSKSSISAASISAQTE